MRRVRQASITRPFLCIWAPHGDLPCRSEDIFFSQALHPPHLGDFSLEQGTHLISDEGPSSTCFSEARSSFQLWDKRREE